MDSFKTRAYLEINGRRYGYYRLETLEKAGLTKITRLPFSIRVLLENVLRREDGETVFRKDIEALAAWRGVRKTNEEISFTPSRVVLQDFTGVPAVVDLAAMRAQIKKMGGNPKIINPLEPVDLVIDHSVQVDAFGTQQAFAQNVQKEFERNQERYEFLKWGQQAFRNFRAVPPGTGIVHQVNLEYLAHVVMTKKDNTEEIIYPDTVVGTDSHTTMINGLGVLGWGVGGIEAEAAMLGQPISMLVPDVIGFKLTGELPDGVTATDLVLTVTQMLRKKGVVGKFVEFFGQGLDSLTLADRATIANMAPEYGATMGFFPVDTLTLDYLRLTGRSADHIQRVEAYLKEQKLFRTAGTPDPEFTDVMELNLAEVVPSLAGPKRPQDKLTLRESKSNFTKTLAEMVQAQDLQTKAEVTAGGEHFELRHGSVVIAAITSCTNTSNPAVMIGAGLVAKKAIEKGLMTKPWVKTSLAPGSQVVMDYLKETGLIQYLEKLKFHLVGFGCTTCIGNSGPLPEPIDAAVKQGNLVVASVLSGNRNFEGRVNPSVRANYLASPGLVVAYALAGSVDIDLTAEPIGKGADGKEVYLKDIWPANREVREAMKKVQHKMFEERYRNVFEGDATWKSLQAPSGDTFQWNEKSTYVKHPPYFVSMSEKPAPLQEILGARVLVMVGDSVTTDHISPAGSIAKDSPAAKYLLANGVQPKDFNSYGSRRGNHEVMMRGTFGNIRLKNLLVSGKEGNWTRHLPKGEEMSIFEAACRYQQENVPVIVLAGKEYGSGSSRDWAAKGPALLGVRAVIAESYERIHRSNLIGMGILPLQYQEGETRESLKLTGEEIFSLEGIAQGLMPGKKLVCRVKTPAGDRTFQLICRIDTPVELSYYQHGGILQFVLRQLLEKRK